MLMHGLPLDCFWLHLAFSRIRQLPKQLKAAGFVASKHARKLCAWTICRWHALPRVVESCFEALCASEGLQPWSPTPGS